MADLPIPKSRDLGVPVASLLIARHEMALEEQEIVVEMKELRLLEIDEEQTRIVADIDGNLGPEAARLDEVLEGIQRKQGSSATDVYRARIKARQQHLLIRQRNLRLLELDEERTGVNMDIVASANVIAKVKAEIAQQRARLSEESHG